MSILVDALSQGDHKVEVSIRPSRTPKDLLNCIHKGYVHLKFPQTQGGTDLYVTLDLAETRFNEADFELGQGFVDLVGRLTLDCQPVKCKATIDLSTMTGHGRLERMLNK